MEFADLLPGRVVRAAGRQPDPPDVAVLEDERQLAELAVELCAGMGLKAERFSTSAAYHAAMREHRPRLVILDWRLAHEVAAAVYMGLRHRFADLPIVIWTGSGAGDLPSMVAADPHTRVVRKATGIDVLEDAIRAATAAAAEETGGAP